MVITKKNGKPGLCVDHRQVNTKMKTGRFPIPKIEKFSKVAIDVLPVQKGQRESKNRWYTNEEEDRKQINYGVLVFQVPKYKFFFKLADFY